MWSNEVYHLIIFFYKYNALKKKEIYIYIYIYIYSSWTSTYQEVNKLFSFSFFNNKIYFDQWNLLLYYYYY
ncbi:MAG: hypothetical protein N7Q72_02710, partial [Spiroplasma sp. Tabriz.8]|nr:hypothetical protein [Spiroplasma sp. Tabriz.8]